MGGRNGEKKIGCGSLEGEKVSVLDIGEMAFFSKAEKTRNNFLATSLEYIVRWYRFRCDLQI